MKEFKFGPNIQQNDINTKVNNIKRVLGKKERVRLSMQFRGRDNRELGKTKFDAIVTQVIAVGAKVVNPVKLDGNTLFAVVDPAPVTQPVEVADLKPA